MSGCGDGLSRHLVCNFVNRDVAIDKFGACGAKVLCVNRNNCDAGVIYEIDVTIGNWSQAMFWVGARPQCRTRGFPDMTSRFRWWLIPRRQPQARLEQPGGD